VTGFFLAVKPPCQFLSAATAVTYPQLRFFATHPVQVSKSRNNTHHQPTHRSPNVVHVTETPCYASLVYFLYALLVCRHSPRWPTSRTHCSSGLILIADLHLVGVPRLPSFSSPDNISYALLVWPHSPCWPLLLRTSLPQTYVRTFARNAVLGITCLLLVHVARLLSFS